MGRALTEPLPNLKQQIQQIFEDNLWKHDTTKPRFSTHIVNAQIRDIETKVFAELDKLAEKLKELYETSDFLEFEELQDVLKEVLESLR